MYGENYSAEEPTEVVSKVYQMEAQPKGLCLIMVNYKFENPKKDVPCGKRMRDKMKVKFSSLGFEVMVVENVTSSQMKSTMELVRTTRIRSKHDCFVCCVSTHGNERGLCGSDLELVSVKKLMSYVTASKCRKLDGKPKVFLIEACRSVAGDRDKVEIDRDDPEWSDFLVAYASVPMQKAYYDPAKGGFYMRCLLGNLGHSKSIPLCTILKFVGKKLYKRRGSKQIPLYLSSLTEELYLSSKSERKHHEQKKERDRQRKRRAKEDVVDQACALSLDDSDSLSSLSDSDDE